jgi:hypothetical protein
LFEETPAVKLRRSGLGRGILAVASITLVLGGAIAAARQRVSVSSLPPNLRVTSHNHESRVEWPSPFSPGTGRKPRDRAVAYLQREVWRWTRDHRCFSCHNNGDAARALFEAERQNIADSRQVLSETRWWLIDPDGWEHNGGEGPASDNQLARIQFGSATLAAMAAGAIKDRDPLRRAADLIAHDQGEDGAWPIDPPGSLGSPATYGRPLATVTALSILRAADPRRHEAAIARAEQWLRSLPVRDALEAASVIFGLAAGRSDGPVRERAISLLSQAQSSDGGWGPYPDSPPEAFDTAIAVLALTQVANADRVPIERGRSYLVARQLDDGSWPETTRPSGAESYAQRISTTAWATLALLASDSQ